MRFKHFIILSLILIWVMVPVIALAEKEPVTITYWTDPRFKNMIGKEDVTQNPGDYERLLADKFEERYPHVTVKVQALAWEDLLTKVVTAIQAGNPPDVLKDGMVRTSYYAYQGLLEPMDKYLSEEYLSDYYQSYLDLYTIQGHVHALPSHAWANNLIINREIWKKAGKSELLPEGHNWTFAEFEKAIREVAKPGELWPFGLMVGADGQGDYAYLNFFWGAGGNIFSDDYKKMAINSPENLKALKMLAEFANDNLIEPGFSTLPQEDINNMFWKHQIAVKEGALWYFKLKNVAQNQGKLVEPFDLDVMHYPHAKGVTNGVALGPTGFAVFKQEDDYKREWVIKFAKFLNNKENLHEYILNCRQFSARKSIPNPFEDDEAYTAVQKLIEERGTLDLGWRSPAINQIRSMYAPIMQRVLLGQISPEKGLEMIEKEGNKILEKTWKRLPEDPWGEK